MAAACGFLYEQGRSYSSQAIVVVVVRWPLVAIAWRFPSKRRNPELIDVVFSLFVTKAKTRPNGATTTITGVGVAALALLLRRWCLGVSAATTTTIASVGVMATGA